MTISLCMIVKNEEKVLGRCLDSVHDIMDEIIIVDTGSQDKTKIIASRYTDKIYDFEWIDDFAAARNFSFSKATMDYILWLDADDVLLEPDRLKLQSLKKSLDDTFDVIMMKYKVGREDEGYPSCVFMRERILKRAKGFTWNDPIHEYIKIDGKILNTDIFITHRSENTRTDRNLKIFEKMIADGKELSDRNIFYYARELFLNNRFDEAITYYNRFLDTQGGLAANYMDASIDLASCYRYKKDDAGILKALFRSFEHGSPRAEVCCQLGFYYKQREDYENAIYWYELASKTSKPKHSWGSIIHDYYDFIPYMELCSCWFRLGNIEKALQYNSLAANCKPDNETVRHNTNYLGPLADEAERKRTKRVLIGSPIYQKPAILKAFLDSLKRIECKTVTLDFMLVDDNADEKSSRLLQDFQREMKNVTILQGEKQAGYICDDVTHRWSNNLVYKVLTFKNNIIDHAICEEYDYLFLIDSDIVIHPDLIEHLKSQQKEIISEIFWTKFHPDEVLAPNVWMFDQYDLAEREFGEVISQEEKQIRTHRFLEKLKVPGVYQVGGLGACTLISRKALLRGVNFSPIRNLTMPGEDRYFCIRAAVLGIGLFVDTYYPAYHIYRDYLLEGVADYVNRCQTPARCLRKYKTQGNKLTLSMIVKNEGKRYLKKVLSKLNGIVDEAVIIDDGSTDDTVKICEDMLADTPKTIIINKESMFHNEFLLRQKSWEETIKTNPDWILIIDADEIFEDAFYDNVRTLINQKDHDAILFRLYDMWDANHYREDTYWHAHRSYRPIIHRYQPDFPYKWNETPQHCGRFPANILALPMYLSKYRLKHYGWATPEDRKTKYEKYKKLDPGAIYGDINQYEAILDEHPHLVEWTE